MSEPRMYIKLDMWHLNAEWEVDVYAAMQRGEAPEAMWRMFEEPYETSAELPAAEGRLIIRWASSLAGWPSAPPYPLRWSVSGASGAAHAQWEPWKRSRLSLHRD